MPFRCPACHSGVDVVDEETAPRCRVCGFSAHIADGMIDFVPEGPGGAEERAY